MSGARVYGPEFRMEGYTLRLDTTNLGALGFVPTTRGIITAAGSGLTGGGPLTTDRSLAVVYGVATGTALEGSRDALYVHLAGDETLTGAKTFSKAVTLGALNAATLATIGGSIPTASALLIGYNASFSGIVFENSSQNGVIPALTITAGNDLVLSARNNNSAKVQVKAGNAANAEVIHGATTTTFHADGSILTGGLTTGVGVAGAIAMPASVYLRAQIDGVHLRKLVGSEYVASVERMVLGDTTGYARIQSKQLWANGCGQRFDITEVTNTTYAALDTDYLIGVHTTAGAATVTLPQATAANKGQSFKIFDMDGNAGTNTITVNATSSTVNGLSPDTITTARGWRELVSDGSNWVSITKG